MEVIWSNSAFKHGITREDISHAIEFKSYTKKLTLEADGSEVWLFIGPQSLMKFGEVNEMELKTEREIEELIKKIYGPDHKCEPNADCIHEVSDVSIREMTEQEKAQQG